MGARINYVLVRPGGYRLFYSHWGASSVDRDAFWGPEATLRFIESQEETSEWLDEIWAEGGLLMDPEKRVLMLFGAFDRLDDILVRRVYMRLLALMWPGWNARWAHLKLLDLTRWVSVPDEVVLTEPEPTPTTITDQELAAHGVALTVARPGAPVASYFLRNFIAPLHAFGPGILDQISNWTDRVLDFAAIGREPNIGGVHVDLGERTMDFWSDSMRPGRTLRILDRWSGWTARWHEDRFEQHLAAAQGRLTYALCPHEKVLGWICSSLTEPLDRPSPARETLAVLQSGLPDEHVTVNPAALADHHGPRLTGTERRAALDRVLAEYRRIWP